MISLIVANGPSVHQSLPKALACKPDRVWGVNKSLRITDKIMDMVLTDPHNVEMFIGAAMEAQKKGVKLWLPPWITREFEAQKFDCKPDFTFEYEVSNKDGYSRDKIAHGRNVGIVALQLALRDNPSEVHLCGFDGYPASWRSKHEMAAGIPFDEIEAYGRANWWADVNAAAQSVMDQAIKDRADVKFFWYSPQITVPPQLANVTIIT